MTGTKQNYKVGTIDDLTLSQKMILEILLDKRSYVLSMSKIRLATGLSESTITKSVRFLRERGILTGNYGFPRINIKLIPRLDPTLIKRGAKDEELSKE